MDPGKETDEHFLIDGFTASYAAVPEPATAVLFTLGLAGLGMRWRH